MDDSKSTKISEWIIFIFLVLFPFGQLLRAPVSLFNTSFAIHPIDIVPVATLVFLLTRKLKNTEVFKYFSGFFLISTFSMIFSLSLYSPNELFLGGLYFIRFFAYVSFFIFCWDLIVKNPSLKEKLLNSLISTSVFIGLFGWIQYFVYPDLTSLKFLGWDDHLYRLAGTFLDPGFTGIILALGFILCLGRYLESKSKKLLILTAILLVSAFFTYSRATYLAILVGGAVLLGFTRKLKGLPILIGVLILVVLFLPRPSSEGVKLERLSSVYPRLGNYRETFEVFKKSPVFGIGFNNLCIERKGRLPLSIIESHSCGGADASLLLVLATTGVCGFFVFLRGGYMLFRSLANDYFGTSAKASVFVVLIHSLFVNSLFYPWVMGWLAITLAIGSGKPGARE